MAGLGSSEWVPFSKAQQRSDGQMGAGTPAQTLSSIELSLVQGLRSSGDPSHLPHIDQSFEFPGEQSWFPRVGEDVGPIERIPYDTDREVTAATTQPCTTVHQPRDPAQTGGDKKRKAKRCPRIKTLSVKHNDQINRQIQKLEPHLRSLILFHFSNTEALQVFALNRILVYRDQHPPIHICRVERKNDDPRSMILLVICLLCPPGAKAPSPFKEPNALAKFGHHFRTVHCGIKNPFACVVPPCEKSFSLRHDMARHVKTAHPEFDGTAGEIEDDIPDPVVASNPAASLSNTRSAFNGSSPVLARHNTSSPSSTPGPNRRVRLHPSQLMASLNQDWETMHHFTQPDPFQIHPASGGLPITTQSGGAVAGPSNNQRTGYMMSAIPPSVGHLSSNPSPMSSHAQRGLYGRPSHMAEPGANAPAEYLRSHARMVPSLSPYFLGGNRSGGPSGAHSQIQSHQPDFSTIVAQMPLPMHPNYPTTNATAENGFARPRQNRMTSSSAQRLRQHMPTRATPRPVAQQWYDPNARHAQALHHQMGDMSTGLDDLLGGPRYIHRGNQDLSTLSQACHAGFIQQHQHPLHNQVDATLNHNQDTPYPPWELPQTFSTIGSSTFTHPLLNPRYPRPKPPQYLGDNVSPDRKSLKGGVETNFRTLLSWPGLIGLMVGVSEAFLSAILVLLDPPRERKGMHSLFLSREGEAHNRSQSGNGRFGDRDYAACYRHPTTRLLTYF